MCSMVAGKLTTSSLAKIHAKSNSFMNMILCRPEFNQFRVDMNDNYFKFRDDINLHRMIRFIIKQKKNMYGNTCRGAY